VIGKIAKLLEVWHLPILLAFVAVWLLGGGYLLYRKLGKEEIGRRLRLGRCVQGAFLAGLAGLFGAVVMAMLAEAVGRAVGASAYSLLVPTGLAAVAAMVTLALLVLYVMFPLPFRRIAAASWQSLALVLVLAAVLAVACGVPARRKRTIEFRRHYCLTRLNFIHRGLLQYQQQFGGRLPPTLDLLVTHKFIPPEDLLCPGAPQRKIGYFYMPVLLEPGRERTTALRACDYRGNHRGKGRNALYANGDPFWYDEDDFQKILKDPNNVEFAAGLRAVDQ